MNNILDATKLFVDAYGYIATMIVFLACVLGLYKFFVGITPVLWRLGRGLSGRKIAVFAEGETLDTLTSLLVDSKLFKKNHIVQIPKRDFVKAAGYSFFLLHWKYIAADLDLVLKEYKDGNALVIYAPQEEGSIDPDSWNKLEIRCRNVVVANMRGRLLNDIVTSLITTSCKG